MRALFKKLALASILCPLLLAADIKLPSAAEEETLFEIEGDSGQFTVTAKQISAADGVGRYSIHFASPVTSEYPENNFVSGELYLPLKQAWSGDPTIMLHILNGDFSLERLMSQELARSGVPAFWFKMPFYGERKPDFVRSSQPITPQQLLQLIDQGVEDFRRSVDFMQQLSENHAGTVNVSGTSMGGILAYHFASNENRVGKICTIMSGGDLWGILQDARETRKLRKEFAALTADERQKFQQEILKRDPIYAATKLRGKAAAGDILMINAREDEVIAAKYAEKLGEALGILDQIVWFDDVGHYTMAAQLDAVMQLQAEFFVDDERSVVETPSVAPPTEPSNLALLTQFLDKLGQLLDPTYEIMENAQELDLDFTWNDGVADSQTGSLHWQRSAEGFSLQFEEQALGQFGVGDTGRPWLFFGKKDTLLQGQDGSPSMTYLEKSNNSLSMKLQLLANFIQYGARVPGLIEQHGELKSTLKGTVNHLNYRLNDQPIELDLTYDTELQRFTLLQIGYKEKRFNAVLNSFEVGVSTDHIQLDSPKAAEVLQVNSLHLQHSLALVLEVIDDKLEVKFL